MKRAFFYGMYFIYINKVRVRKKRFLLQELLNLLLDVGDLFCGLETGDHLTFLVDEEFGEVPLDVRLLLVVGISLGKHVVEDVGDGVLHIPAGKAFLLLQELIERVCIVAVDLDLLETGELCAEVQFAELVNALICARCLLSELVAGEIENLESLGVILLVELLQFIVLRGESAFGCCVDNQQHLVGVLFQRDVLAFSVLDSEVINSSHCMLYL